jgi:hypothetical protein
MALLLLLFYISIMINYNFLSTATLIEDVRRYVEAAGLSLNPQDLRHECLHFLLGIGFTRSEENYLANFEIGFTLALPGSSEASEDGYVAYCHWDQDLVDALLSFT